MLFSASAEGSIRSRYLIAQDSFTCRQPNARRQVLDLSLFPVSEGTKALRDAATAFKPDLVCFSWRDIQIFSPHEGDSSLEHAFNFYFASNPLKRVVASFEGVKQLYRYYSHIYKILLVPLG